MSKLYKYRLKCTTDDKYEYVWSENGDVAPTLCPTNSVHTIDSNLTAIVEETEIAPQQDADGALLNRMKIAKTGHHFQKLFAVLGIGTGTIKSKLKDGTDIGYWTATRYDVSDVVTTDNAQAVKTVFEFVASHDVALLGCHLWQKTVPANCIDLWVMAAPHIPKASGGEIGFMEGGADLCFMGSGLVLHVDGKAPKDIKQDLVYYSHKIELTCKHEVSQNHEVQISVEYFKPSGV